MRSTTYAISTNSNIYLIRLLFDEIVLKVLTEVHPCSDAWWLKLVYRSLMLLKHKKEINLSKEESTSIIHEVIR